MALEQDLQQESFNSDLEKLWVNILYTGIWVQQLHAPSFKQEKISRQQFNILRILRGQHPKAASVQLLTERMLEKSSNASRIVEKLVQKGLVERLTCESDRRQVDVKISAAGLAMLARIDSSLKAIVNQFNRLTSTEIETLNTLLDRLRS